MESKTSVPSAEAQAKIISIFGGTQLAVNFEDASTGTIRVRQLRLSEYEKALPLLADEIAITAFCCSVESAPEVPCAKEWALTLHPKSYEAVQVKVREVNAEGFFTYAVRKQQQEQELMQQWVRTAAELPPEALKTMAELGKSHSPMSLPRPRAIPR